MNECMYVHECDSRMQLLPNCVPRHRRRRTRARTAHGSPGLLHVARSLHLPLIQCHLRHARVLLRRRQGCHRMAHGHYLLWYGRMSPHIRTRMYTRMRMRLSVPVLGLCLFVLPEAIPDEIQSRCAVAFASCALQLRYLVVAWLPICSTVLGVPLSLYLWYFRCYRAGKTDKAFTYLVFFCMYFLHICFCIYAALGFYPKWAFAGIANFGEVRD